MSPEHQQGGHEKKESIRRGGAGRDREEGMEGQQDAEERQAIDLRRGRVLERGRVQGEQESERDRGPGLDRMAPQEAKEEDRRRCMSDEKVIKHFPSTSTTSLTNVDKIRYLRSSSQ